MEKNNQTYSSKKIVEEYSKKSGLTKPELTILNLAANFESKKTMLDIGVGTGRTTDYFLNVFEKYVGVDYSSEMISICNKKYKDNKNCIFKTIDARDLSEFQDNSFDFTMFSFNGIDCIEIDDRVKVFTEIIRVGKNKSYFAFSSHNIYNIPKLFSFQMPKNPLKYFKEYERYKKVKKINISASELLKQDIININDGDLNFQTHYTYIKPEFQMKQLQNLGFNEIEMFDLKNGKKITSDVFNYNDPWIYYLCKIFK